MKPKPCTTQQCRGGVPSLRCLAVAAVVFAALAFASGAFAQTEQEATAAATEEGAGESDAGPSTPAEGEAAAEPRAEDTTETSETPEEVAGDVEPFEDTADSGDDEWGEFDDWEEEESAGGSGDKPWAFQLGGFVEGLVAPRVVRSSASANEFTSAEARFRLNVDAVHEIASARFRGDVFVWVRIAPDGRVERCHLRDPSWFQWPLLEAAIEGNIVADFPLCNKSFNCSYSGHDL